MSKICVKCTVEGLTDHWIEYDVSKWSTARYFRDIAGGNRADVIPDWIEPYSVDWNVTDMDGEPIPHPGPMPDFDAMPDNEAQQARVLWQRTWNDAWDQVPLDIVDWLNITAYLAMSEVMAATRKRVVKRAGGRSKKRKA